VMAAGYGFDCARQGICATMAAFETIIGLER
jgi:hypothetical protein